MTTLVTVQQGGTNANNAVSALTNLGAANVAAYAAANAAYAQANIVYTQANNAYAQANAGGGLSPFLFLGAG